MAEKTKIFRIYGKQKTNKATNNTFTAYSYTQDGKEFFDVHFRKTCQLKPTDTGYVLITVVVEGEDKPSIGPAKKAGGNEILWIGKVLKIIVDEEANKKAQEKKDARVNAICAEDDLPF